MKEEGQSYAIWLVPDDTSGSQLDRLIGELARRFDTPPFAAHATLCSGKWNDETSHLVDAVDQLSQHSQAATFDTIGLCQTNAFFQFFYIALAESGFDSLVEKAQGILPTAHRPEVGPHVSLLYSDDYTGIDRIALTSELASKIPTQIQLDTLELVFPKNNNWGDISNWKVVHTSPLKAK